MTTGWLLLLLLVVILSSHSVDSQSTTDDEVCDGDQLCQLKRDLQTMMNRLGELHEKEVDYRVTKLLSETVFQVTISRKFRKYCIFLFHYSCIFFCVAE